MPTFDVAALEEEHQKRDVSKKCCVAEYQFRPPSEFTQTHSEVHKKDVYGETERETVYIRHRDPLRGILP